jgi:hypothetical protein
MNRYRIFVGKSERPFERLICAHKENEEGLGQKCL